METICGQKGPPMMPLMVRRGTILGTNIVTIDMKVLMQCRNIIASGRLSRSFSVKYTIPRRPRYSLLACKISY